eukprot:RCo002558
MGGVHANVLGHIEAEYDRVFSLPPGGEPDDVPPEEKPEVIHQTRYLTYEQLKHIRQIADLAVDWGHLPTLFVVDLDHDGRFSMEELKSFAFWVAGWASRSVPPEDFTAEVQARCVLQMWKVCSTSGPSPGQFFAAWVAQMLAEAYGVYLHPVADPKGTASPLQPSAALKLTPASTPTEDSSDADSDEDDSDEDDDEDQPAPATHPPQKQQPPQVLPKLQLQLPGLPRRSTPPTAPPPPQHGTDIVSTASGAGGAGRPSSPLPP